MSPRTKLRVNHLITNIRRIKHLWFPYTRLETFERGEARVEVGPADLLKDLLQLPIDDAPRAGRHGNGRHCCVTGLLQV